jgi:hypothetical protein
VIAICVLAAPTVIELGDELATVGNGFPV